MGSDDVLDRFRSAVRADIARGGAKPLRSYIRLFGVRFADEITREYAALVAPTSGLSLGQTPAFVPQDSASPELPPPSLGLGGLVASLTEKEEIARGGMGAIVRVRDESLQRDLAMKVVLSGDVAPSREALLRFVEEARVQARLDHPGVVPIHHLGTDAQGRVCFTMKLVQGRSLAEILAATRQERASLVKTVQTLLRVCETIAFAHEKGVIHRDLKPANVMVGEFGEVYVMDWGLAKRLGAAEILTDPSAAAASSSTSSSGLTQAGAVLGTPTYMPPEQAQGKSAEVDARSDVYSIGAILYEALAGRAPYQEPSSSRSAIETLRDVLAGPPAPLARFAPRGFEELVSIAEKAMSRDPAGRYPSAREMREDLQSWIEGRVVRAHRTGAWTEFTKWVRRNKAVAASAAASVAVVAAVVAVAWRAVEKERDDAVSARDGESAAKDEALAAKAGAEKARDEELAAKNEAIAAKNVAEAATRRMDGNRLSIIATTKADEDATLASLLAYEGALRAPGAVTNSALFSALRGFGELHTLIGTTDHVKHGFFSPDGKRAYAGTRDGRVIAWDVETGREIRRVALGHNDVVDLELLEGGKKTLAVSMCVPSRVLDAETLRTLLEIPSIENGHVFDGAVSPDGTKLAIAQDGAAWVADLATGKEIARTLAHGVATKVRWSPDGKRVASCGADYHVRIWDPYTGRQTFDLPLGTPRNPPQFVEANPSAIAEDSPTCEWSGDGRRVVSWGQRVPDRNHVVVWDATTGKRLFTGDADNSWVELIGLMPGRRRAIVDEMPTKGGFKHQSIVDLDTGAVVPVPWNGAAGDWHHATFSADGKSIALVSAVGDRWAVGVWATETGAHLRSFVAHDRGIAECAFSPDASKLLTCGADDHASLWELSSDSCRAGVALRTAGTVMPGTPTPEIKSMDQAGRLLAFAWRKKEKDAETVVSLEIADAASGRTVWTAPEGTRDVVLSPDGRRAAVIRGAAGDAKTTIEVVDVPGGRTLAHVEGRYIQEPRLDATGRRLAFRAKSVGGPKDFDDSAFVLDVETAGAVPSRFDDPDPGDPHTRLDQLAFSPDGSRLAAAQAYQGSVIWDVASGKVVSRTRGHNAMMMGMAFSPDGARIATAAVDTAVTVHDVATGAQLAVYTRLPRRRSALAWSNDGSVVAAESIDVLCLFDSKTGAEIARIPRPDTPTFAFKIGVAGERFVGALRDGTVRSWPIDPVAWFAAHRPRELVSSETSAYQIGDAAEQSAREIRRVLECPCRVVDLYTTTCGLIRVGRMDDAERCVRRAREVDPDEYYTAYAEAALADAKGDLDAAFEALRRALRDGSTPRTLESETAFPKCRADPRWKTLVGGD